MYGVASGRRPSGRRGVCQTLCQVASGRRRLADVASGRRYLADGVCQSAVWQMPRLPDAAPARQPGSAVWQTTSSRRGVWQTAIWQLRRLPDTVCQMASARWCLPDTASARRHVCQTPCVCQTASGRRLLADVASGSRRLADVASGRCCLADVASGRRRLPDGLLPDATSARHRLADGIYQMQRLADGVYQTWRLQEGRLADRVWYLADAARRRRPDGV